MSEYLWFSQNHRDMSVQYGDDAGFDFEFYCERCGDTWRSGYEKYGLGRATGWLRRAGNMAGGVAGNIGWDVASTAEGLAQSGWHKARDAAFQKAITKAGEHFHRCGRCHHHVCDQCWATDRGLCRDCAPDVQAEVEQARNAGLVDKARSNAYAVGEQQAQTVEVATEKQLVCLQCGAETHGAKFCPECGQKQGGPSACGACQTPIPTGAKFCPECGAPAA